MAGQGPIPKRASVRQRRNRKSTASVLGSTRQRRPPALAPYDPDRAWDPRTRRWWRAVWASPMAVKYLGPDQEEMGALAILKDLFFKNPSAQLAGEIRLESARFGLTVVDRARLDWVMTPDQPPEEAAGATAEHGEGDPRAKLHLLAGGPGLHHWDART